MSSRSEAITVKGRLLPQRYSMPPTHRAASVRVRLLQEALRQVLRYRHPQLLQPCRKFRSVDRAASVLVQKRCCFPDEVFGGRLRALGVFAVEEEDVEKAEGSVQIRAGSREQRLFDGSANASGEEGV